MVISFSLSTALHTTTDIATEIAHWVVLTLETTSKLATLLGDRPHSRLFGRDKVHYGRWR
jgi:hypothetical protein